ncbi:hypothetical protein UlMin_022236 [Ulmus minor]
MASSKIVSRLSSRLHSLAFNSNKKSLVSELSPVKLTSTRISRVSRLPVQLSSIESMVPLHSAVASARLISSLSAESQGWGLVPQGISMPL